MYGLVIYIRITNVIIKVRIKIYAPRTMQQNWTMTSIKKEYTKILQHIGLAIGIPIEIIKKIVLTNRRKIWKTISESGGICDKETKKVRKNNIKLKKPKIETNRSINININNPRGIGLIWLTRLSRFWLDVVIFLWNKKYMSFRIMINNKETDKVSIHMNLKIKLPNKKWCKEWSY